MSGRHPYISETRRTTAAYHEIKFAVPETASPGLSE